MSNAVDKIITFSAFAVATTSSEIVVFPVIITQATFKSMHLINADSGLLPMITTSPALMLSATFSMQAAATLISPLILPSLLPATKTSASITLAISLMQAPEADTLSNVISWK